MKLVSYRDASGDTYGVAVGDGIVEVGRASGLGHADLKAVLEAGALDAVRDFASGRSADVAQDSVTFLPPIGKPDKIIMVGLNYATHIAEGGREPPKYPMLFPRWTDSHVAHGQAMLRPKESKMFDFEGELAVVIGKTCRRVSKSQALKYVAGYTCYNDGSIRDYQRHTSQFVPGKNFHKSGSFGPWMTTADEIPNPAKLRLTTRLNGEVVQDEGVDDLIFSVPELIAYCSSIMELVPGDTIVTGTPSGVGMARKPQLWMKPGDPVEVALIEIGVLRDTIKGG